MSGTWQTKQVLPAARASSGAVELDTDKIHCLGGGSSDNTQNWQYSDSGNTWTTKAVYIYNYYEGIAAPWDDNNSFQAFGDNTSPYKTNKQYSASGDSWASKTQMPTGRFAFGSFHLNGDIFLVGASPADSLNEKYNKAGDSWDVRVGMPASKGMMGSYNIGTDKGYAVGGYDGTNAVNTNWEYSKSGNNWTTRAVLPAAKRRGASARMGSNKGYYAGGDNFEALDTNYEYTQNMDSWLTDTALPVALNQVAGAELGSGFHAIGGYTTSAVDTNYRFTILPEALEDLKTELIGDWPTAFEDLKTDLRAYAWAYEYLKCELVGTVYEALEDLKTSLVANAWGYDDLKTQLAGHGQSLEDLKCELQSSLYSFEDLKCDLRVADRDNPYVLLASLSPTPGQTAVPVGSNLVIKLRDDGWGVDVNQCWVDVREIVTDGYGGEASSTTTRYKVGVAGFSYQLSADKRECTITIDPPQDFGYNRKLEVKVFAVDLAGNCGTTGR